MNQGQKLILIVAVGEGAVLVLASLVGLWFFLLT